MNKDLPRWLPYIILILAAVLSYFPTFTGEFILDDKPLVEHNHYITSPHSLQSYLMQEDGAIDTTDPDAYHTGYYRPLINLSYWLDYEIWGLWAPGFRTTNLILHILCVISLYHVLVLITNDRNLALWSAAIFAIHPVNTEAVSWVSSRNNVLTAFFTLSALFAYIRAQEKKGKFSYTLLSIVCFGGAVFSKEFGIMLLPVIFLYRILMIKKKFKLYQEVTQLVPFIVVLFVYFILREKATSSWLSPESHDSVWKAIYFTPYIIATNLKHIFLPFNLHSFIVTYPDGYLSWQIMFGCGSLSLMAFLVWKFRKNRLAVFGISSFLVTLIPILNIVPTSGISLFSMRWLYFPMAFLTPLFAALINGLLKRSKQLSVAVFIIVSLYLGVYSVFLNKVLWHDEETFFATEIGVFNNTYYAYGWALNHLHRKDYQGAEKYFRIALNGYHSSRAKTHIDYAAFLNDMGRPDEALLYLKKARSPLLWPKEEEEWHRGMGVAYLKLNRTEEALSYLETAVDYGPDDPVNWANLGAAFAALGMYKESVDTLRKGLEIDHDAVGLRKNLAITYTQMGDYEKADEALSQIPPNEVKKRTDIERLIKRVKKGLTESGY